MEAVLDQEPALVNFRLEGQDAPTALFCLPDEETAAADMAALLLRRGADPGVRDSEGRTAAEHMARRGLDEAAELIGSWPASSGRRRSRLA